jgi:hypothetical protein
MNYEGMKEVINDPILDLCAINRFLAVNLNMVLCIGYAFMSCRCRLDCWASFLFSSLKLPSSTSPVPLMVSRKNFKAYLLVTSLVFLLMINTITSLINHNTRILKHDYSVGGKQGVIGKPRISKENPRTL